MWQQSLWGLRLAFPWPEGGWWAGGPYPECGAPVLERRRPRRNTRRQRQDHADSCVVSSDDEELSRDRDVYVTTHTPRNAREETSPGLRYLHAHPLAAAAILGPGSHTRKPLGPGVGS